VGKERRVRKDVGLVSMGGGSRSEGGGKDWNFGNAGMIGIYKMQDFFKRICRINNSTLP